ncbi:MAG: histidine phosphotransferase family protein [Pseudomonadota bacterium]
MNAEFPMSEADLCALIGSRICHDLVSPVGAIGNGVELMSMGGVPEEIGTATPELDLVRESVSNAQTRLRFFRIAYGQASAEQDVGRAEVLAILTELYKSGRLRVHWGVEEAQPRRDIKLAFLILQCLESAMPFGGQARIWKDGTGWCFQGEAEKLRLEPILWEALDSGTIPSPLRPSQVHFALIPQAARALGRTPTVRSGAQTVLVTA